MLIAVFITEMVILHKYVYLLLLLLLLLLFNSFVKDFHSFDVPIIFDGVG